MTLLLLLIGLVLVIAGGDLFVRAAIGLAEILRVPRVLIGGTLMALATTTPEFTVSVLASLRGEPGLAVGNAVGSVICNVGLIAGTLGMLAMPRVDRRVVLDPLVMLLVMALVLLGMSLSGTITPWKGAALVAVGVVYFSGDFLRSLLMRTPAAERKAAAVEEVRRPPRSLWATLALFVVGAGLVVFGSRLLVDNAVALAQRLGISPMIIGATLVAVGTSLPEYVTAILSARRGVADLSVGNIIGANIANLTVVAGAAALHTPVTLSRLDLALNFPAMFLILALFAYALLVRARIGRRMGVALLVVYLAYVTVLVTLPQV